MAGSNNPFMTGAPAPSGGTIAIPIPPLTQANTGSEINNRNANTGKTQVDTAKTALDLQTEREMRAQREKYRTEALQQVDTALSAIRNARQYNTPWSTGALGGLVGTTPNGEGEGGTGLAGLPLIGPAVYGGSDRSKLDTNLGIIDSAQRFFFAGNEKEKERANGGQGASTIPIRNYQEFMNLGTTQFNLPKGQEAGQDILGQQLNTAEESFLRRKAGLSIDPAALESAKPEERSRMLEAAYQRVKKEYFGAPPAGSNGGPGMPTMNGGDGGMAINTSGKSYAVDPSKAGLNDEISKMIRRGVSSGDIVAYAVQNGVPMSPELLSSVQANSRFYAPYVGKELPKNIPTPVVDLERKMVDQSLGSRLAGYAVDNPVGAAIIGGANGVTMGGLDELAGMIGGPDGQKKLELLKQYEAANHAPSYIGGNIVGAVAPFSAAGKLGATALRVAPRLGALAGEVAAGSVNGALENNQDRTAGAVVGGVLSLGGAGFGAAAGKGLRAISENSPTANGILSRIGMGNPGAPSAADRAVAGSVADATGANNVLAQAQQHGAPMTMADADPGLRALAGSATRNSTEGRLLAENTVGGRAADQANRAALATADLAPETNVTKLANDLRSKGSAEADPFYKNAYGQPAPLTDPELSKILQRPAVQKGLQAAKEGMANRGEDWQAMGFDVNKQGDIVMKKGASFEALDRAQRGIGDYIDANFRDPNTGILNRKAARDFVDAQTALKTRMGELNPDYQTALDTYSPYGSNASQLDYGGKAITATKVNPKQIAENVNGLNADELRHYQIGAANKIIDKINTVKDNADPWQIFRSPDMRGRLEAIFPDKASAIQSIQTKADLESLMSQTRTELLGGSQTAARGMADEAFSAAANGNQGQGILRTGAELGLAAVTHGGSLVQKLMDKGAVGFKNAQKLEAVQNQQALANDLAPILLMKDPAKAKDALNGILKRVSDYDKYDARMKFVTPMVGAAAAQPIMQNTDYVRRILGGQ